MRWNLRLAGVRAPASTPADWLRSACRSLLGGGEQIPSKRASTAAGGGLCADRGPTTPAGAGRPEGLYRRRAITVSTRWPPCAAACGVRRELQQRWWSPRQAANVADWYARADLFAAGSRRTRAPNLLLEAMACGCPLPWRSDLPTARPEILRERAQRLRSCQG